MFFWRADVLLDELRQHLPKTADAPGCAAALRLAEFRGALKQAFPLCDNISIDYAVLEKAANVCGIPAGDFGWNDVGSWNAVYELLARDDTAMWSARAPYAWIRTTTSWTPAARWWRCWASRT